MSTSVGYLERPKNRISASEEATKLVKFCLVGLSGVGVFYGSFLLLIYGGGLSPWLATAIGHILSVTNNFTWNELWTFNNRQHQGHSATLTRRWFKYLLTTLVAFFIAECTIVSLTGGFGIAPWISGILAIAVATPVNYGASRFWVWRTPHGGARHENTDS